MKNYAKGSIAVLNANAGSTNLLATLADGVFAVPGDIASNATNIGWTDQIAWSDMLSYTRTAYAAGTYGKLKIDFSSVSPTASAKYTLRVYQVNKPAELNTSQKFDKEVTVFAAASGETDLTLAIKFYNAFKEIAASSDIVVTNIPTAGSSTEFFYIEGQFSNAAGTEYYAIEAETNDTAIITLTDAATFVQQSGTPGIINGLIPTAVAAGAQFVTYDFKYDLPVKGAPHGHKDLKEITAVVYVIAAVDTAWKLQLEQMFSGLYQPYTVVTAITAAADASYSAVAHGLSVGDLVLTYDISTADGDHLDEWLAGVQNVWHAVKAVTSVDVFTIELDTSGYDAAATGAKIKTVSPYLAR